MIKVKFKPYIIKHSSSVLKRVIRQKKFPNCSDWRKYKLFFNENNVPEELIEEYEQHWEKYWIELQTKEGEKLENKRNPEQNTKCNKAG